jgi:hypothetical protein
LSRIKASVNLTCKVLDTKTKVSVNPTKASSNQLRDLGNQTKEWAGIHRLRDGRTLQHRQTRLGSQVQQLHLGKTRLEE